MAKKKQKTPTKATADRSVLRVSTLLARDAFITETITITLKYITRAKHNPISMKMIKDCLINLVLIIILLNCLRWHHLIFCIASVLQLIALHQCQYLTLDHVCGICSTAQLKFCSGQVCASIYFILNELLCILWISTGYY